jgi:hypothetical protein
MDSSPFFVPSKNQTARGLKLGGKILVIPAQAGIQNLMNELDARLRGHDGALNELVSSIKQKTL